MRTKRILSVALFVLALCQVAVAQQRLDIMLKNRSVMSCPLDDINYMEIVEGAAPGELDGVWYLGWKATNNGAGTQTHVDGTEMLIFTAGPQMKWVKAGGETVYNLEYPEGGAKEGITFKGVRDGSSISTSFTIVAKEDDLLLIKQGTTRY